MFPIDQYAYQCKRHLQVGLDDSASARGHCFLIAGLHVVLYPAVPAVVGAFDGVEGDGLGQVGGHCVAIVGYDDIAYSSTSIVPLSSVRQSPEVIGARAMELLQAEAENEHHAVQQIVIQPELVIRESSRR